ncbi:hypothetical protein FA13DRAFT_1804963 [Coprinellus micaceus]|uniref:Uncharacterized protein n=1 Tax=Coprinellus micaceus TaxID=71717 RepID=A0A4Y7S4R4_COPMI|nr:hypothetical protein FA13DRAFT_1804963 [Coprinellus micaceus]
MALVTWIAVNVERIIHLNEYSDDHFAPVLAKLIAFYSPYAKHLPTPQCRLLSLWDKLGIPHKEKKQLSGSILTIIGISVNTNNLRFTLPDHTSEHDFPIHPNPTTFSNYVMYMCDFIKPDSVVSNLSGIVKFLEPFFPDIYEVRSSQLVTDTVIGCKRLRHASTIRKSPLTMHMLSNIVAHSGSSYDDLLFQALSQQSKLQTVAQQ